ncbi:MAG: SDR family oxidoreductase [Alicyclobacillus sp.]|nr:SDR family oxidoreductase [Alicyclobacillus sp.]
MNVLIIGGTKGIGRATALRFSLPGNRILLNYATDVQAAAAAKAEVEAGGVQVWLLRADAGQPDEITQMMNEVRSHVQHLDLIVHCAVETIRGNALELTRAQWERAIAVSNLSILQVLREAMPLLGYGSTFIALSSRGAQSAIPEYAALGATKAFTEALVRYLVLELAPRGIRINVVSPGTLDTEALRRVFPDRYAEMIQRAHERNPSGRGVTFEDVTELIAFLASPGAQMVQGRVIVVDGGLSLL